MNDPFQPDHRPTFGAAPTDNSTNAPAEPLTSGTPAGLGIRAGARVIDSLVGSGVGMVSGVFGPFIMRAAGHPLIVHSRDPAVQLSHTISAFLTPGRIVLTFAGPILYHSLAESISGTTLGKLLCGLRVVREDQGRISFGAALIRNFAYFIDAMCFAIVAYLSMKDSPLQQRLGDKWAHSVVVRVGPGANRIVSTGIILGLSAWLTASLLGWLFVGT